VHQDQHTHVLDIECTGNG